MLMAEQEPYALMVQPDDMLISPREVNDNIGTMVCFHPPAMPWATITIIWTKTISCRKCT